MARTNEYKSEGGSFEKLADALHSINELLEEVKRADEEREVLPQKRRGFRNVISELQHELDACMAELMKSWNELDLDPLYINSTEEISVSNYTRHIKFLHPVYEHVWLTEGKGKNVASELIPFIDYGMVYDYSQQKLTVSNLVLETKLNLPDFKTSLQAAHVDLEILKEDAKRVELVCENGEAAQKRLSETLTKYCTGHEIALEIIQETVPFAETNEERAARLREEAEVARKAALEAKKKVEEEEKAAKKKVEEEEKAAKKKAEEEEKRREREEEKAAREARATRSAQEMKSGREKKPIASYSSNNVSSHYSSMPPIPSATPGRVSAPPIPPPLKKSSS